MQKTSQKQASNRIFHFIFFVLLCTAFSFIWHTSAQMQLQPETRKNENRKNKLTNEAVTVHAVGRGDSRANFLDGEELRAVGNGAQQSQLLNMTSADFDSDGVADLVTADSGGVLHFYHGNADSIFPNNAEAQARRGDGIFSDEAFSLSENHTSLSFTPDFLEAGDFNADGNKDILAAARGGNILLLLVGDGRGNFIAEKQIAVGGKITALQVGEIGHADGQTDVAVGIVNEKGAQLLVFEHPQGAFAHEPEAFTLSAPANALAIGNLDDDFYADVAAASGNILTIVQGRGQAFPWDLNKDLDIKRPAANVLRRVLPFTISDLTIGKFADNRASSLAILSGDGSIYTLESVEIAAKKINSNARINPKLERGGLFMPTGNSRSFAKLASSPAADEETAQKLGISKMDTTLSPAEQEKQIRQKAENIFRKFSGLSKEEKENLSGAERREAEESKQRSKKSFLRSLAAKPTDLAGWNLKTLVSDARLSGAANSSLTQKLKALRVSGSNKDDLLLLDVYGKQIHIVAQPPETETQTSGNSKFQTQKPEIVSLATEGNPLAVLPMRLNTDALDDLVVLENGAANPSIVQTAPAQILMVNTTDDGGASNCFNGGTCNLRDALNLANNLQNATINFNIPGGGVHTIAVVAELPTLTHTVTIDATTQPGYAGTPLIEIDGGNLSGGIDGIKIRANNCVVRGLAINRFPHVYDENVGSYFGGNALSIETTSGHVNNSGNIVEGNFLGVDPNGAANKGNASAGLIIFSADNNTIGGTTALDRNVISGNGASLQNPGIGIESIGDNNVFENNFIGTNAAGNAMLPNTSGILLSGANNQIGKDGAGNVISGNGNPDPNVQGRCLGNGFDESLIFSADDPNTNLTLNNTLKGNKIGTNASGTGALGNCGAGITTNPLSQLVIGSAAQNGRNIISGNGNTAIDIEAIFYGGSGGFTGISGDNIGTDITGTTAIPNDTRNGCSGNCFLYGVVTLRLDPNAFVNVGAPNDSPNMSCTGFCTLVSGNKSEVFSFGAVLHSGNTGTVGVFNSFVGTDTSGTSALPNSNGIYSFSGTTYAGLSGFGTNVISGNSGTAIFFQAGYGYDNFVQNNLIGTDITGHNAVPNNSDLNNSHPPTVYVSGDLSANLYIGGTDAAQRNVISGNRGGGIRTFGQNVIQNNYIGVDSSGSGALPNTEDGIDSSVEDAGVTFIGGTNANQANVIRYNGGAGIDVYSGSNNNRGAVEIRGNSIANNGGLGIDLNVDGVYVPDGVTQNDCDDSDTGPNNLQNYPELNAPTYNNGSVTVHGTLVSTIRDTFTIDFYANNQADSSNYGEGEMYLGSLNVQTDLNGFVAFNFTPTNSPPPNQIITATATDLNGETSEFSCGAGLCQQNLINEMRESEVFTCANPIIVNTTTDDADAQPDDGLCDTDVNTADLQCSLRAAIQEADRRGNGAYVAFEIPGNGVQTITPTSALPPVTAKTTIDATTQPGYNGSPLVEVKGTNAGTPVDGLDLAANKIIVRGLAINSFSRQGIFMHDASNMTIESCYVGTDSTGNVLHGNGGGGIGVYNSSNNTIGGTNSITQNVINGNANAGIFIALNSPGNTVTGNRIGITVADSTAAQTGVQPIGVAVFSSNNTIGGAASTVGNAPGNIISGNYLYGVEIGGDQTSAEQNVVAGNIIGTNGDGHSDYGNGYGVYIFNNAKNNTVGGTSAQLRNLISANSSAGVEIKGGDTAQPMYNSVRGNYIGTDITGNNQLLDSGQLQANGVVVLDAHDNYIGGAAANARNIISGNGSVGIVIQNSDPTNDLTYNVSVNNNYIGIGQDGSTPVYNKIAGIVLSQKVHDNNIGGAGAGNVISGNLNGGGGIGIGIGLNFDSYNNQILGNYIGTNSAGTAAVPNFIGIVLAGAQNNYIGGIFAGARNIISGNSGGGGIVLSGNSSSSLPLQSNSDKTSQPAETFVDSINRFGQFVPVNSERSKSKNTQKDGAKIVSTPVSTDSNFVTGNYIGTNLAGTAAIPNSPYGVGITDGATFNYIGLATAGGRNLISGNDDTGIFIGESTLVNGTQTSPAPVGTFVQNNFIGTDKTGGASLPNMVSGIFILGGQNTNVGGTDATFRNVISGNGGSGVLIQNAESTQNTLDGNYIGVSSGGANPVGNMLDGINLTQGARNTQIHNNLIANNGGSGVRLTETAGTGNLIDPNSIFANTGLGIDFGASGQTPNDLHDADSGANNLQNFPEMSSVIIDNGGNLSVRYKIDSSPSNSNYGANGIYVEFFKADGSLSGQTFIGSDNYTVGDYNSGAPGVRIISLGNAQTLGLSVGDKIVATATDADGNTSEFTGTGIGIVSLSPTAAPVTISGRVTTASGSGVNNAQISLVDSSGAIQVAISNPFGYYRFENMPAGATYIVSAKSKRYQFAPQVVSVTEDLSELNFIALPW